MSYAAEALGAAIREYPDPVRPCIVILDGTAQERQHFTGAGEGPCWVVSDGRLLPWLLRFRDHGFSEGDIARLRALADPARIRETERTFVPRGRRTLGNARRRTTTSPAEGGPAPARQAPIAGERWRFTAVPNVSCTNALQDLARAPPTPASSRRKK